MVSRIAFLALGAVFLFATNTPPAQAGTIDHAFAWAYNLWDGPAVPSTGPQSGTSFARSEASDIETPSDGYLSYSYRRAWAEAGSGPGLGPLPASLTRFENYVELEKTQGSIGGPWGGVFRQITSEAKWIDSFSLSTSVQSGPFELELLFFTEGLMFAEEGTAWSSSATTSFGVLVEIPGYGYAERTASLTYGVGYSNWDSLLLTPTLIPGEMKYEGLIRLRVPVSSSNGLLEGSLSLYNTTRVDAFDGYAWDGKGARAYVSSVDSSGLQSVLINQPGLGASTPEELGWDLAFGSGMRSPNLATAVPEPAGIVLIGSSFVASSVMGMRQLYRNRKKRVD